MFVSISIRRGTTLGIETGVVSTTAGRKKVAVRVYLKGGFWQEFWHQVFCTNTNEKVGRLGQVKISLESIQATDGTMVDPYVGGFRSLGKSSPCHGHIIVILVIRI